MKYTLSLPLGAVLCLVMLDAFIGFYVKDRIYYDIEKLPQAESAVVLGTSKYYVKGVPNLFYQYRLNAAFALFQKGKVRHLLVSGDNQTPYYNEPKLMFNDLRKMGVAARYIQQDFAGYRTLDSVVRAKKVFHLSRFILVTQAFHCERALFIAKYHEIDAVCYVAEYPEGQFKVRIRELFARVGMLYDYIIGKAPETLALTQEKEVKTAN